MARLRAIEYLTGSVAAPPVSGVTIHRTESVSRGLNLYTSGHTPGAVLMTMEGDILHEWKLDFATAFPAGIRDELKPANSGYWRRAYPYPNGDVVAIYEGLGIVKVDKDSSLLWAHPNGAHHDLEALPNGSLLVLTREPRIIPGISCEKPILEDFVTWLNSSGKELRRVSIVEAFQRSERFSEILPSPIHGDVLHVNTVEVLDGRLEDRIPAFRRGNILLSSRQLDTIMVLDPELEEIVWVMQGSWRRQHQPTVIAGGNILLFDNWGKGDEVTSTILELEPVTGDVIWSYGESPGKPFYTKTCGSNIRLPNGNTLITESDNGRAFEVNRKGEIVWQFVSPHRAGRNHEKIATLFEVVRLPLDFDASWAQD